MLKSFYENICLKKWRLSQPLYIDIYIYIYMYIIFSFSKCLFPLTYSSTTFSHSFLCSLSLSLMVELGGHRPPQRKARSTVTKNINSLPRSTPLFLRGIHLDGLDRTVMPSFLLCGFHFFVVLVMGSSNLLCSFIPTVEIELWCLCSCFVGFIFLWFCLWVHLILLCSFISTV